MVRPAVLARDRYRCQLRLEGEWKVLGGTARCKVKADCVHHVLGKGVTGDDPRYMVAACTPCNLRVGDPSRNVDPPHRSPRWL